jgi:signal transduction histidine kinase
MSSDHSLALQTTSENKKSSRLAWSLAGLAIVVVFIAVGMGIYYINAGGDRASIVFHAGLSPFITVAYAIVGALVASRQPKNPIGWIFLAVGLFSALTGLTTAYTDLASIQTGGADFLGANLVKSLNNWLWMPTIFLPTIFVFLLFPDGRLLSPRWRIILWSAALGLLMTVVGIALHPGPLESWDVGPNPYGLPALVDILEIMINLGQFLLLIGFVGAIISFALRFRRSQGVERQQMKWLVYALGLMLVGIVIGSAMTFFLPESEFVNELLITMTGLAVLAIAVAASVAILRYRLYDIDLVINRTLVYGGLTVGIIFLYILVVGGLSLIFQTRGNLLIGLIATGTVALLFHPLHVRLQRAVNRFMYGDRDEPFDVMANLGRQLENTFEPEMVYPTIVKTVAQTLKLPYAAIAIKKGEGFEVVELFGQKKFDPQTYSLTYQGEVIGQLLVDRRGPDEEFSEADERLLRTIARQAGTAVHAVQLTADLQRSRQQLVTAQEEERRRLRRDLHDGLGPALASVVWQTDSARDLVYTNPDETAQLLDSSIEQAQTALSDIRRLVYGLRPPALDELGLVGALRQEAQNHHQVAITVDGPDPLPQLPAAVEVAAYRIAREAITNAAGHGQAQNCSVDLQVEDGLSLTVNDDGVGLPEPVTLGVGLVSMRERAAELGGTCTIGPRPEGGAVVEAFLPLE